MAEEFDLEEIKALLGETSPAPRKIQEPSAEAAEKRTSPVSPKRPQQPETQTLARRNQRTSELTQRETPRSPWKKKSSSSHAVIKSIPFFSVLTVITLIAWALPLRPTISESEKRSLKTFPEFTVSDLLSGDYFSGVDDWFSDTFTFRENWISAANRLKRYYGIRDVAVYGRQNVTTPTVVVESEPLPTVEPLPIDSSSSEVVEETLPSQEAEVEPEEEDIWGGVVINDDDFVSSGATLVVKNAAFKYTGYNKEYCQQFAQIMNNAAEALDGKANLYLSLVPENGTSMLSQKDRLYYGFGLEEEGFELINSNLSDKVHSVDALSNLIKHNDEYIVFRTDHHWTALGAYYAYEQWCKETGVEPVPLSQYTEVEWPGFLGTYYYTNQMIPQLGDTPDTVYAYVPPGNVELYMNSGNGDSLGSKVDIILDRSVSQPGAKYMTFLGSDQYRYTFVNNDITDGSAIMIIKTSFGNPYVYYFTQHYQYVYVVDYRYYTGRGLTSFVENFNISDVIVVGGLGFVAEKGGIGILRSVLR